MKKSRVIIITVIATLLVVSVIAGLIKGKGKASQKGKVVRLETAQQGELVEYISAPGEIEPKTNVEISAKVSARIIELPYEEGNTVTCGDPHATVPVPASVLVRLDAKDLESRLISARAGRAAQAAQAEVEKARIAAQRATLAGLAVSLEQAQRDLKRKKGLLQSQDISQSAFDEVQCKVDELKAQYAAQKHSLESAELNLIVLRHNLEAADAGIAQAKEALNYTTITSPIDGVITRINAEVGEMVVTGTMNNPGTVIMQVADLSEMLLVAQVDEADIGKLKLAQHATVRVQAFPENEFKGVVHSLALTHRLTSTGTKYFRTEILLANDPNLPKLYSGLTGHVDIETKKHTDVLKVPSQAVLGCPVDDLPLEIRENCPDVDSNKTFATVVYRYVDDKAVVTPVKTGPSNMTHTIILSGIAGNDKIVVGPYKVLEGLEHDQKISDERESEAKKDADGKAAAADTNDPDDDQKARQDND